MMRISKFGAALLLASPLMTPAAFAQPPSRPAQADRTSPAPGSLTSPGVVSGYGNYWYPTGLPFPSVGGSAYINYGPGGSMGTYYSVPATPSFSPTTSNQLGGLAGTIQQKTARPKAPAAGVKPSPPRRKPL